VPIEEEEEEADESEWSASRSGCFNQALTDPGVLSVRGWLGYRSGVDCLKIREKYDGFTLLGG
jgi:hypothetical protein